MNLIVVSETVKLDQPLAQIKTFEDFCKVCLFPFIVLEPSADDPKEVNIEINGATKSIIKSDTGFQ
jgi:hypothetical protein